MAIFRTISFFAAALLALVLTGCGTTPATQSATTAQLGEAQETLARFSNDPEMGWFRANVHRARAIIISPRVPRAAFVVGGSGGEALVTPLQRSLAALTR